MQGSDYQNLSSTDGLEFVPGELSTVIGLHCIHCKFQVTPLYISYNKLYNNEKFFNNTCNFHDNFGMKHFIWSRKCGSLFFKDGEKLGNFQKKISAQQKELKKIWGREATGKKNWRESILLTRPCVWPLLGSLRKPCGNSNRNVAAHG